MSGHICGLVFDNGPKERNARFVLLALGEYADKTGRCFPLVQSIATRTLFTREYVGKTIDALVKQGWISRTPHPKNHRSSGYQINLEKLSSREASSHESKDSNSLPREQSSYEQSSREASSCELQQGSHVNSVGFSCELVAKPPHPLIGVTVNNRHEPSLVLTPEEPPAKAAKSRHEQFKEAVRHYWESRNPGVEMPWNGAEGKALGMWLGASPNTTLDQFVAMLRNRYRSEVAHTERPSRWIGNITTYAAGAIDRYGKPLRSGKIAPPAYPPGFFDDPPAPRSVKPAKPSLLDLANGVTRG